MFIDSGLEIAKSLVYLKKRKTEKEGRKGGREGGREGEKGASLLGLTAWTYSLCSGKGPQTWKGPTPGFTLFSHCHSH